MSQVKITVRLGDAQCAVITYSPEYGASWMGAEGVDVQVEESDPRTAMVPVLDVSYYQDKARDILADIKKAEQAGGGHLARHLALVGEAADVVDELGLPPELIAETQADQRTAQEIHGATLPDCYSCNHPAHPQGHCPWDMTGPDAEPGRECGCLTYLY